VSTSSTHAEVLIRAFRPGDELAFRQLNEAWITRFFVLEAKDKATLGDPQKHILQPGGQILFAQCADVRMELRPG
jgi:hypothetical protein